MQITTNFSTLYCVLSTVRCCCLAAVGKTTKRILQNVYFNISIEINEDACAQLPSRLSL